MKSRQRTRRVPVALPTSDIGPAAWLRSIRLSGFTIAVLTLVILTVVVLAPSLRILVEQRQEIAALTAEVERQQAEVDDLEAERARWDDPSYLQSLARERLDYVYPGELSFLVIDDGSTPTDAEGLPISDDIQTTDVDWVSSLFSSVLTAALTDAPAGEIVSPSLDTPAPDEQAPEVPAPEQPAPDAPSEEG
ncbi:FtsB family cell division protein [Marisediminicola sp. LYQ85]|uniref:FtsB family cell division protein n=1 Tax=Marisediminicola sp. LYQ85 TaxID=3391062 RepID=UPI003982EC54